MNTTSTSTGSGGSTPGQSARRQHELLERALAKLVASADGLTETEEAKAEALRQAALRLVEIADVIESEGLVVAGSMKQARPHPLLGEERALRREINDRLSDLDFRVGNRVRLRGLSELTREPLDGD